MDASAQIDILKQVRNNTEDFHQYARDLKLWETEMKRKDRELSEQSSVKDVPPIRKKTKKEESNTTSEKPQRISSFDYSSWEKFDVVSKCGAKKNPMYF
ncbi:RNA polymerase II-associated protein 3-like [Diaphorina citri]|uniref:RNA polymerase II-associated protein 3-like n=1 Tax=Diaphorina citri TaxID=121845 RepID=A0A3Q0J3R3_DIACI|nr:RNA polymerase II-associated protein 3-like [Diaphorina citri]